MRHSTDLPFRYVLTVSELTREIKDILEMKFPEIWVQGEISNLRSAASGHLYFTLKDELSQIRAVLFRNQARATRFQPEEGLEVICRGRITLYERRGEYQLVIEALEPKGLGALQLAFLQLKEKLEKEGLFDPLRKRPLPLLPQRIGIVTSPTGAVIQDMIQIIQRRFENVHVLLYPVRVQGEGASREIARGIEYFNEETDVDVIIVGRGGGSLEDLWAFNEEEVARAIYRSRVPIISAVGHETDYTIADFVADLRAPTPSAAAELVVRDKREWKRHLGQLEIRLEGGLWKTLDKHRSELVHLQKALSDPRKKMEGYLLRVDELMGRLSVGLRWKLQRHRERCFHLSERLSLRSPRSSVETWRGKVGESQRRIARALRYVLERERQRVRGLAGKLDSLSPLSILERGYSITRRVPSLEILRDASKVKEGERVEVKLHRGALLCEVEKTETP